MLSYPSMLLLHSDFCIYCGNDANTIDHFPAKSVRSIEDKMHIEVSSCLECNCIGHNRKFLTLQDKRTFLNKKAKLKGRVKWNHFTPLVQAVDETLLQIENGNASATLSAVTPFGMLGGLKLCNCCPLGQKRKYCTNRCAMMRYRR